MLVKTVSKYTVSFENNRGVSLISNSISSLHEFQKNKTTNCGYYYLPNLPTINHYNDEDLDFFLEMTDNKQLMVENDTVFSEYAGLYQNF